MAWEPGSIPGSTLPSCASAISGLHRVKELNLEEKQWQLDQELRGYMNREGLWADSWPWRLNKHPSPLARVLLRQFRRKAKSVTPSLHSPSIRPAQLGFCAVFPSA